jgi:hypothetical protein
MARGSPQIEILVSTRTIDRILNGGADRLSEDTIWFLKKIKQEKKRHEKIKPISSRYVRAVRILG